MQKQLAMTLANSRCAAVVMPASRHCLARWDRGRRSFHVGQETPFGVRHSHRGQIIGVYRHREGGNGREFHTIKPVFPAGPSVASLSQTHLRLCHSHFCFHLVWLHGSSSIPD